MQQRTKRHWSHRLTALLAQLVYIPAFLGCSTSRADPPPKKSFDADRFVGGWGLLSHGDTCTMFEHFDGPGDPNVSLIVNAKANRSVIVVGNDNWKSIKDGEAYNLVLLFDGANYLQEVPAVGIHGLSNNPALAIPFEGMGIGLRMASAQFMALFLNQTILIKANLKGTREAFAATKACAIRNAATSTTDPFAADDQSRADSAQMRARPAVPRGNPDDWVNSDDYPSSEVKKGHDGITTVTYSINISGRVSDCLISKSSGFPELDAVVCPLLLERARFYPAIGTDGKAVPSMESKTVAWHLPETSTAAIPPDEPHESH